MKQAITQNEIEQAQQEWGASIVRIGKAFIEKKEYKSLAEEHVHRFYGYGMGTVLFKPTKVSRKQFRHTFESALSYFIGGNPEFPNDAGFALNPWSAVRFENSGFILKGDHATAMGNYFFTDLSGNETKVEYTFGYFRADDDSLKINLHHSSLPFSPN